MARTKAHYSVTVLDLLNAGLLKPGDELTFEPRKSELYKGRVEANGDLTLGGRVFQSPSSAATTLARASGAHPRDNRNGWKEIKANGRPLMEYRDQLGAGRRAGQRPSITPVSPAQTQHSQRPPVGRPSVVPRPKGPASGAPSTQPPQAPSTLEDMIRAHLDELKRGLANRMASLSAGQFEEFVAEFLRWLGYAEVRRVGGPGDRNIDVTASYPAPFIEVPVRVQVKHRRTSPNVGPTDVAAFRDRAGGADHLLLMATNAEFTGGAEETASEPRRQLVHLVDGKGFINSMIDKRIGVVEGRWASWRSMRASGMNSETAIRGERLVGSGHPSLKAGA